MTNGEKWLAAAHKRIAGYCAARGWRYGPAIKIGHTQHAVYISDRFGKPAEVTFEICRGEPQFVDDRRRALDFNVSTFEDLTEPFALAPKAAHSKRQLCLALSAPADIFA